MGQSEPQTFQSITPEQFARMVAKARAAGIDLNGNSGTASKMGVEVTWNYVPDSQELKIQCLKAPFFMSTRDVDARIKSMVTESLA